MIAGPRPDLVIRDEVADPAAFRPLLGDDVVDRVHEQVARRIDEEYAAWQNERTAERLRRLFGTPASSNAPTCSDGVTS